MSHDYNSYATTLTMTSQVRHPVESIFINGLRVNIQYTVVLQFIYATLEEELCVLVNINSIEFLKGKSKCAHCLLSSIYYNIYYNVL